MRECPTKFTPLVCTCLVAGRAVLTSSTQVPGSGNDRTLRIFAFADAGNVWAEDERTTWDSLRASVGLGLSWISPVGPLKLSWGRPVQVQRNDRIQRFQFQIGTAF